jgi:phage tail protein X
VFDHVDAAYRQKYGRRYAQVVESITAAEHRATTLRLLPQNAVTLPLRASTRKI